jgi:PPP family 3-phenylpropionic acid transporter
VVYAAHQLFGVAIPALADSLAVEQVRQRGGEYARLRLGGSLSFLGGCWLLGWVLHLRQRGGADPLIPLAMATGYGLAAMASFGLRGDPGRTPPHLREVRLLIRNRRFVFLLAVGTLHWATLAPYHGFLAILSADRGFTPRTTANAFVVAVASEVMAFFWFPAIRRRLSLVALLTVATAATSVRWLLLARSTSPAALVWLQALHALSYGVFWASAMAWLGEAVPPAVRATGQAVFTTMLFGVGNLVGYAGCGFLYDRTGGASAAFAAGAVVELIPLALTVAALLRRPRLAARRP